MLVKNGKENNLDLSKAEVGDTFYIVYRERFSNTVQSISLLEVKKVGKRDIICENQKGGITKFNKNNFINDTYLDKAEIEWAYQEIKLKKKRMEVYHKIQKIGYANLSEELCDIILNFEETQQNSN